MTRTLVDASVLIALARVGELDVLRSVLGEVHTTSTVLAEVARPDKPDHHAVASARRAGWLVEAPFKGDPLSFTGLGLGPGETSLFLAAEPGDVLVVDDLAARRLALARGLDHTGLLGLLVASVRRGRLPQERALRILDKLAAGAFHMTAELYAEARRAVEEAGG